MNTDDFETRLSRQPLRPPPPQWRAEILAACGAPGIARPECERHAMQPGNARRSVPWWLAWLVPGRAGWATLGAAWGVIVLLHFASAPERGRPSSPSVAISPEAWEERRRLMAELLPPDKPAPAPAVTRPRGERRDDATTVMTA
jgi:hypothetical protein